MQMVLMIFDPLKCNLLKIQLDEIRNGNLDDSYVASGQIGRTCFCADPKFADAIDVALFPLRSRGRTRQWA